MKNSLFFCFISTILLGSRPSSLTLFSSFTLEHRLFLGKTFGSIFTSDWLQCLQSCAENTRCLSYSFDKQAVGENCFLHECGFLDECAALDKLIFARESVFHQLQPVTVCIHFKNMVESSYNYSFYNDKSCQVLLDYLPLSLSVNSLYFP